MFPSGHIVEALLKLVKIIFSNNVTDGVFCREIDGAFCRGENAEVSVSMEKVSPNQAAPVFSGEQKFRICA